MGCGGQSRQPSRSGLFAVTMPELGVFCHGMKLLIAIIVTGLLGGCSPMPSVQRAAFVAAPGSIDQRIKTASIEDYILALPPYAFHEESIEQFTERVRQARASEKRNHGKSRQYLFVGGDGSSPAKEFTLNRGARTLEIRSFNWEPGLQEGSETWRRVSGGWIQGSSIGMDLAKRP